MKSAPIDPILSMTSDSWNSSPPFSTLLPFSYSDWGTLLRLSHQFSFCWVWKNKLNKGFCQPMLRERREMLGSLPELDDWQIPALSGTSLPASLLRSSDSWKMTSCVLILPLRPAVLKLRAADDSWLCVDTSAARIQTQRTEIHFVSHGHLLKSQTHKICPLTTGTG